MLFAFGSGSIDSLGDILGLLGEEVGYEDFVSMKDVVVIDIADLTNGFTNDFFIVKFGVGSNFSSQNDHIALNQCFASNTALGILFQTCIQYTIGNEIRNFIWVAFANGFRGECKRLNHVYLIISKNFQKGRKDGFPTNQIKKEKEKSGE